jgi:sodium transport system permease protein
MSKNILTIIKKELRRFFTDRRMLVSLLLPGLLIFILYSFMGDMTSRINSVDEDYIYQVQIINEPSELTDINHFPNLQLDISHEDTLDDTQLDLLSEKEIDLIIVYETDFYSKMLDYEVGQGTAPLVEIYYNSTKTESSFLYSSYLQKFNQLESQLSNKFDINQRADTIYNFATEDDVSIQIITSLLPFLLLTFLFSGAMSISAESIAGEKERGTIATLLITPTKKSEIALGKVISLSIVTLVSAASSFTGLMLSIPKLMGDQNLSTNMYSLNTYILLFIVIVSTVFIYVVLLSIISAYSKSIKEASALAVPLMIINMLVGISSMLGISSGNITSCLIPVYNSVQSITAILSLEVNVTHLVVTIMINLGVVIVGVFGLTKMFNSEKIMFNS